MIDIELTAERARLLANYIRTTPQEVRRNWVVAYWGDRIGVH